MTLFRLLTLERGMQYDMGPAVLLGVFLGVIPLAAHNLGIKFQTSAGGLEKQWMGFMPATPFRMVALNSSPQKHILAAHCVAVRS